MDRIEGVVLDHCFETDRGELDVRLGANHRPLENTWGSHGVASEVGGFTRSSSGSRRTKSRLREPPEVTRRHHGSPRVKALFGAHSAVDERTLSSRKGGTGACSMAHPWGAYGARASRSSWVTRGTRGRRFRRSEALSVGTESQHKPPLRNPAYRPAHHHPPDLRQRVHRRCPSGTGR